jgi:hypothetical protein
MKNKNQKNQLELLTQSPNHPITEKTVHNSANELVDHPSLPSQIPSGEGFQPSLDPSLDPSLVPSAKNTPIYQVGDDVICHPTVDHAERKKQVKATIVKIEYSGQYLHHCEVEYLDKNGDRQTATIGGGSAHYLLRKAR